MNDSLIYERCTLEFIVIHHVVWILFGHVSSSNDERLGTLRMSTF